MAVSSIFKLREVTFTVELATHVVRVREFIFFQFISSCFFFLQQEETDINIGSEFEILFLLYTHRYLDHNELTILPGNLNSSEERTSLQKR